MIPGSSLHSIGMSGTQEGNRHYIFFSKLEGLCVKSYIVASLVLGAFRVPWLCLCPVIVNSWAPGRISSQQPVPRSTTTDLTIRWDHSSLEMQAASGEKLPLPSLQGHAVAPRSSSAARLVSLVGRPCGVGVSKPRGLRLPGGRCWPCCFLM